MADVVYIEPLLPKPLPRSWEKRRALLAGAGGQTALNIASELSHNGTLERLNVELIGSDLDAIDKAEDRVVQSSPIVNCPSAKPWRAIPSRGHALQRNCWQLADSHPPVHLGRMSRRYGAGHG